MRSLVIFLTALFLLHSSTTAGSLAYYPWEREQEKPAPFVSIVALGTVTAVITADHIHKLNRLSKRPLLSKEDVRGLKSRRILMPIGGAFFTAHGVGSILWAEGDVRSYVISGVCFVNGALFFVDGLKSHKVLSKYNSQK